MPNGASQIRNARDLIDRYYRVHLGRELPEKYLQTELDYAESLFRRYTAGPEFIDSLVQSTVGKAKRTDELKLFTDIRGEVHRTGMMAQREWINNQEYKTQKVKDTISTGKTVYKESLTKYVEDALSENKVPSVVLDDMKQRAQKQAKQQTPIPTNNTNGNQANNSLISLLKSAQRSIEHDIYYQSIATHLGFPTEEEYTKARLQNLGLADVAAKYSQQDKTPAKKSSTNKQTVNTQDSALSSRTRMSTAPVAESQTKVRHKIATEIEIQGYQYDPRSKKNIIIFTSPSLKTQGVLKLRLERKTAKYDAKALFQPDIYDQRFVTNNPPGTKMVATLNLVGGTTFATSYLRRSSFDISQGNFTLIQIDQPSPKYGDVKKRHVAMRWAHKAVRADQVYVLQEKFKHPQTDLIKTSSSWWGYQLRVVENGIVKALSKVHVWEPQKGSSPTFTDLEGLVNKYNQAYAKNQSVAIEIALCECVKVIPTIKPTAAAAAAMLDTPTILMPGRYDQAQLGGQVMTRGLIEHKMDPHWGRSVVSSGAVLDMPAPNMESRTNHIQQHILDPQGSRVKLDAEIALSASGKTKQPLAVSVPVYAAPKPVRSAMDVTQARNY